MARLSLTQAARPAVPTIPRFLAPSLTSLSGQQTRYASVIRIKKKAKKARPVPKDYRRHKLEKYEFPQFSLVEAMRYVYNMGLVALGMWLFRKYVEKRTTSEKAEEKD